MTINDLVIWIAPQTNSLPLYATSCRNTALTDKTQEQHKNKRPAKYFSNDSSIPLHENTTNKPQKERKKKKKNSPYDALFMVCPAAMIADVTNDHNFESPMTDKR